MSDLLLGELLCLFLLILINGRIFFSAHKNSITIAILSPVVLIVSIFQILAQGLSFFELVIFVLSLFTFIFNIHAFSRLVSNLYVDQYRVGFYLISLLLLLCSAFMIFIAVYFREVPIKAKDYGVTELKEKNTEYNAILWTYTKSTESASDSKPYASSKADAEPDSNEEKKPVIIFGADERSDTYRYRPYLIFLAREGYTVYSMDVFDNRIPYFSSFLDFPVFRRSMMIFYSLFRKDEFISLKQKMTESIKQEYKALREIVISRHGENAKIFVIGDEMQKEALEYFNDVKNVEGTFSISLIDMYKTKGYGCIAQTSPFLAYLMSEKREKSMLVPLYMAKQTDIIITSSKNIRASFNAEK